MLKMKSNKIIVLLTIMLLILNFVVYTVSITFDFPVGDHWRLLNKNLIPYLTGNISFFKFLIGDFTTSGGSGILTLLFEYVNYTIFSLRYELETYIGIVFYLLTFLIICINYTNKYGGKKLNWQTGFFIITASLVWFGLDKAHPWGLVGFERVYLLMGVAFLILTERYLTGKTGLKMYLAAICILSFLGGALGTLSVIVGIIFVAFYVSIKKKRICLDVIFILIISFICQLIIYSLKDGSSQPSRLSSEMVINQLLDYKELSAYFVGALSQPLFDPLYNFSYGNTLVLSIIVMLFTLSVFVISGCILLKNRAHEWTIMPTLLIMYSLVSMISITFLRLPLLGFKATLASRYTAIYEICFVGCLLALAQGFSGTKIQSKIFLAIIFSFVLVFSSTTTFTKWKDVDNVIEHKEKWRAQLIGYALDKSVKMEVFDFSCLYKKKNNCEDCIDFLYTNRLSLFTE